MSRYGKITGNVPIKDDFHNINTALDNIESEMDAVIDTADGAQLDAAAAQASADAAIAAAAGAQADADAAGSAANAAQEDIDAHAARTDNPHGIMKSQVGLGSVQNYDIASQLEAEAGAVNNKYMTPQRTAQAITALAETPLGAQAKADAAEQAAKTYADAEISDHATAAILDHPDDSVTDAKIGSRTVDDTIAAAAGADTPTRLWSKLANRIKAITGKSNWYAVPATTLEEAKTHADATDAHSATSVATANRIMMRDAAGRAKVAAPSASDDIARKDNVDAVQANLTAHIGSGGTAHANVVASGAAGFMTGADKAKLDGIAAGAEVNAVNSVAGRDGDVVIGWTDVQERPVASPTDISDAVAKRHVHGNKAILDDVEEPYTTAEQVKLSAIESGAQKNQYAIAQINDIEADSEETAVVFVGGLGITLSTNPLTRTVTITATGSSTPGAHGSTHGEFGVDPIPMVTTAAGGLMSATDKVKLDAIPAGPPWTWADIE